MTNKYKKKLIEVAIPLEAINAASAREKSIRHGHPSTLHLWWARRPLAACRAVLFAQLVDDPSEHVGELLKDEKLKQRAEKELGDRLAKREQDKEDGKAIPADDKPVTLEDVVIELERKRLFKIIEDLVVWENSTNEKVLERARAEIRRCCNGEMPPVYDPFSGGGSIPLEAQRLGLPAYGSDLNPVAVMIGKSMIEIPPRFADKEPVHPGGKEQNHYRGAEGLAEDIEWYASELSKKARKKIGHLYPKVTLPKIYGGGDSTVLAWLWARTVRSPNPAVGGAHIPLISSFWLSKKANRLAYIEPILNGTDIRFEVRHGAPKDTATVDQGTKVGRGANFRCLLTGDAVTADYVKSEGMAGRMKWRLMAIVAEGPGGRCFVSPTEAHEQIAFSETPTWRPEYPLSQHPQYMSVTNYGPTFISDLFMDRQTIALNTFSELIEGIISEIEDIEYKEALRLYLSLCVTRLANRQSTSTFWNTTSGMVEQVFAMQALPMRWDTAEGNPFSSSTGNFLGQVSYLTKAVRSLPCGKSGGEIKQLDAQMAKFDGYVISSDPPYYDNVPYADLSDFFYVWLKKSLKNSFPNNFGFILTPKMEELVADHQRHQGKEKAEKFFLSGMESVFARMSSEADNAYPAAIYYAFRQGEVSDGGVASKGWATFLEAMISAGYEINATWPMRTEDTGKLKKTKNVLATSVVMSCRPRHEHATTVSKSEFIRALKRELPSAMKEMQRASISPVDMPQASIGPGIGIFSRYAAVLEGDDSHMTVNSALQIINQELDEFLSEQEGEFDPDTRFALNWFAQNGYDKGQFGDADNLARARGISVESVKHAGVIDSAAGSVRILTRDELQEDWDPATDTHLTVWECCQYLIRALEVDGEYEAAILLKKIGPDKADAVKDLAYSLYEISSNKRKDAKEANSYNALIAVWAELTRQAASIHDTDIGGDRQTSLNL